MAEPPAQREQAIERHAHPRVVDDVAPRQCAVQTTEHLARLAVRVLVGATFVTCNAALALGEVCDGVGRGAAELIGEMGVVLFDFVDDGPELRDDFEGD
jgi:hypothetical protein